MDEYAVKRNLRKGLQLYQDNKNRLASMRDENGQLPDALRDRQTELANQRQQWLSTIEELKAKGVLEEREGEKLKAKFLD
jgi:Ser/Thr protein kinase RdoA (MazF antagonist)